MKKKFYCVVLILGVSFLSFYPLSSAVAQGDYPNRPIEVIIPYPPGGSTDRAIRFYSEKWQEFLGQPVIPVNKPGGGATIGAKLTVTAKPDGYTLFGGSDSPLITARLGRKDIGYDLDSFRIVFQYGKVITFFSVKADSKWKTINDLLADARQNPGKIKYASYGIGAMPHFATEMLSNAAGVKMTYVPYKSSPESLTALIGGHVDMAATAGLSGMAGSPYLRNLAIAEEERVFDYPDVPTLKELGYPVVINSTNLLAAPKGITDEIVNKFVNAHRRVYVKYEKEIKEQVPKLDSYPVFIDGKTTMKNLKEREKKYREMAPKMGIRLE